ncbi:MAG: hypothetical protein H0U23_00115 [Blastocatellia bacterium]|nr:hypothetical protein [Blastocatellia bacterium]
MKPATPRMGAYSIRLLDKQVTALQKLAVRIEKQTKRPCGWTQLVRVAVETLLAEDRK